VDLSGWLGQLAAATSIPALAAFLLGLLTAIAPCPLATNIAALAYISRGAADRRYAAVTGALYTLGRTFSYSLLGFLIIVGGLEIPGLAGFLQSWGARILGPLLIVVGVAMLFVHRFSFGFGGDRLAALGNRVAGWGMFGGFLLGVVFALAFCPYSGILFFGLLIPLALQSTGGVGLPAIYAIGTGLPVLVFGILIAAGVSWVSGWFNALSKAEKVIRYIAAAVFIGVGIYYVVLWVQAASR
jgi:cytochrome c-type biogenesis protein